MSASVSLGGCNEIPWTGYPSSDNSLPRRRRRLKSRSRVGRRLPCEVSPLGSGCCPLWPPHPGPHTAFLCARALLETLLFFKKQVPVDEASSLMTDLTFSTSLKAASSNTVKLGLRASTHKFRGTQFSPQVSQTTTLCWMPDGYNPVNVV